MNDRSVAHGTTVVAHGGAAAALAGRKVVPMPPLFLFVLAAASMAILAVARVIRVHFGRTPFPDVPARFLWVLAFLVGPPIVAGVLTRGVHPMTVLGSVPAYLLILAVIAMVMAAGAVVAQYVAPGRARPLLMLALAGREPDPYATPVDPPLSKRLAESLATVDAANAAFPRGSEFPNQIDRPGFRSDWDALDAATRNLEGGITGDRRLGVAVNSRASAVAGDARNRLDTLRGMARASGQSWPADAS